MKKVDAVTPKTQDDLLEFLTSKMKMASYYQPLMIRTLIEHGGRCTVDELARIFLCADDFEVERSRRIVMRWPHRTLTMNHGFTRYDRASRMFSLAVKFKGDAQRKLIVDACTSAIEGWHQTKSPKVASNFYKVIDDARGCCQACGIPGHIRPIDVDHIVPQAKAERGKGSGKVLFEGSMIPVDDPRNLQALCTRCNRGKRDTSSTNFKPTADRLVETILLVLAKAGELNLDAEDILRKATAKSRKSGVIK